MEVGVCAWTTVASTTKDVYPLPRIDDTLDCLKGAQYFSSMDMHPGYWQIEVDEAYREKMAFITSDGLYKFNVMPFGLCNVPTTFERSMDNLFWHLKWQMCLCYLDDIIVFSLTFNGHLRRLHLRAFLHSRSRTSFKYKEMLFWCYRDQSSRASCICFQKREKTCRRRLFIAKPYPVIQEIESLAAISDLATEQRDDPSLAAFIKACEQLPDLSSAGFSIVNNVLCKKILTHPENSGYQSFPRKCGLKFFTTSMTNRLRDIWDLYGYMIVFERGSFGRDFFALCAVT
ncbi:retrovirus-related Pol polyprotein from transposon 412 [Trichonephila inaurata madagascariensis]|uniref:Retrovirus-related Pol polyprotein from transposon 412 n=1 Tax=Trichonephila inaurata madagascariensis TaxID=2747483 RepID=A0A8X7CDI7_9ARAC|nr:retrovirus-related Pol polyprotein from transposon 412 [Trichonephila inaurata madagascariensis]